jgi:hypothetical protein
MFNRVINKIFKRGGSAAPATGKPSAKSSTGPRADSPFGRVAPGPGRSAASPRDAAPAVGSSAPTAEDVRNAWQQKASRRLDTSVSAEELCGIAPGMSKEEIQQTLAALYRRHNRAASSLDEGLRQEAEAMLEAIAAMREKYLGS